MPASGAGGLSAEGGLQRQFRDIHAASSHIALTWDIHGAAYGQSALGLPSPAGFLLWQWPDNLTGFRVISSSFVLMPYARENAIVLS